MDELGDRIKGYESSQNTRLVSKVPVILRVDGKAFHTFTSQMAKPFDNKLIEAMVRAGEEVSKEMMGFVLGYHQSDEFTFMMNNTQKLESQAWFNNEIMKIVSITASLFTAKFNSFMGTNHATFDCRAFNVPIDDAPNVFIWRQRDWERNSLQMLSRYYFSHKSLLNKNKANMHEMLHNIGVNWNDLPSHLKNGTFITPYNQRICEKMTYQDIIDLVGTNDLP